MEPADVSLSVYVPLRLLRRLAVWGAVPLSATADRGRAAMLFADVSGFTALTESLAERGPEGAELLARVLESVFGAIVEAVIVHGGDVVRFAGDAVIAVFEPGEDGDLDVAVRAAAACGVTIQQALGTREAVVGENLTARVGIASGEILTAIVGGEGGRFELLVAGEPVARMGVVCGRAVPGEVRIDARLAGALAPGGLGARADDTVVVTAAEAELVVPSDPPTVREDLLRRFVPRGIQQRLDAGHGGWLAEFRRVTVLFAGLEGLDFSAGSAPDGAHAGLAELQAVTTALQAAVYRLGGSVNQFLVDDKGTVLLAVWGLPHATHEDDPARAARAALEIVEAMASLGVRAAVGVTTGRAFAGLRGSHRRREYAVFGAVVNRAARLMSAAGAGNVLCDETTSTAASARLEFTALEPIRVKGVAEPLAVFRPTGERRERRLYGDLIGRAEEMRRSRAALDAVRTEPGAVTVVVSGEAGIGKSHVLAAVVRAAEDADFTVLRGAADAVERSTPYFVWRDVFRGLFTEDPGTPELADAVRARLADSTRLSGFASLVDVVLPIGIEETEETRSLTGEGRADAIRDALLHLLEVADGSPQLIVLDDAHWFDTQSWALLAAASRKLTQTVMLVATRPLDEPVPVEFAQLRRGRCVELPLDPLPPGDAAALLCDRLGVESVPDNVSEFVGARSGGNPFFSEQLVYALRDRGFLVVADGRCEWAPGTDDVAALDLPDTVEGVVTGRIDALTPQQQLTLKVASAIGRAFAFRSLDAVHPVAADRPDIPVHLDDMARRDLVREESPVPDLAYLFKHVVLQEVAYKLMSHAQRRALHASIATFVEARFEDDLEPHLGLLAHHWGRAENQERALHYLERAGVQALDRFANPEAIRYLDAAVSLDAGDSRHADPARRSRWHWWLGTAHLKLSDYEGCARHVDLGLAHMGRPVATSKLGLAASLGGQVMRQTLHRMMGGARIEKDPERRAELLQAGDMFQRRAEYGYFNSDPLWAIHSMVHNLNLAERCNHEPSMAEAYAGLAVVAGIAGRHGVARYYAKRGLTVARRVNRKATIAFVHLLLHVYYQGRGDWSAIRTHAYQSIELFDEVGDRFRWEGMLGGAIMLHLDHAEFDELDRVFERLYASAHPASTPQILMWCMAGRVLADAIRGRIDEAHTAYVDALLGQPLAHAEQILGLGALALAYRRSGDARRAEEYAQRALDLAVAHPPGNYYLLYPLSAVAEVFRDTPSAQHQARAAVTVLKKFRGLVEIGGPAAHLHAGWLDLGTGRPQRGARRLRRALRAAERADLPLDIARACAALSQYSATPPDEAARLAARGLELLAKCGAEAEWHWLTGGAMLGASADRGES